MAEVKPIGFNYARYKAQVFDLSSLTRQMASQVAAQRKAQQEAKKELDKMMANTYAAKGKGRLQDMPELEKQYNELQNYYTMNNSAILKGGKEFMEFQKKRSDFIFEAEQANLRKERDKQLSPFFKLKLEKEGLSDKSNELMTIFNLPYNDPRRKEYRYEGSDGQMHGIDELNVTDIDKYTKFNEVDLIKDISTAVQGKEVSDLRIEPSAKFKLPQGYQISVTDKVFLRDPVKIAQVVTGTLMSKPDARNYYQKLYNMETPESLQQASEDYELFNNIYKAAGYGQIVNTERDNIKGISTPEEYAIYRNLKANLPQELGEKISTSLMTAELSKERLDLGKRQFGAYESFIKQNMPIDTSTTMLISEASRGEFGQKQIKSLKDFARAESAVLGNPYTNTGGTKPVDVFYVAPGEAEPKDLAVVGRLTPNEQNRMGSRGYLVYKIQTPMITGTGENATNVKDMDEARKLGGDAFKYGTDLKGNIYKIEAVRIPIDANVASPVVKAGLVKSTYGIAQSAQQSNVMYDINWKRLQGGGGRQPLGMGIETGGPTGRMSRFLEWGEQNYGNVINR